MRLEALASRALPGDAPLLAAIELASEEMVASAGVTPQTLAAIERELARLGRKA
jgi:hypothetical protein